MIRKNRSAGTSDRIRKKTFVIQVNIIAGLMLLFGLAGGPGPGVADPLPEGSVVLDKLTLGINMTRAMGLIDNDLSARIIKHVDRKNASEIVFKIDWLGYSGLNGLMVFSASNRLEALYVVFPKREHKCLSMSDFTTDVRTLKKAIEDKHQGYTLNLATPLWSPDNDDSSLSCHDLPRRGLRDLLIWTLAGSRSELIAIGGMTWNTGSSSRSLFSAYMKIAGPNKIRDEGSVAQLFSADDLDLALDRNVLSR